MMADILSHIFGLISAKKGLTKVKVKAVVGTDLKHCCERQTHTEVTICD